MLNDKEKRAEERLRKQDAWEKAQALSRPRHGNEDIHYRGVGKRIVQVMFYGTGQPLLSFDIRQQGAAPSKNKQSIFFTDQQARQARAMCLWDTSS